MKKTLLILLAAVLVLAAFACSPKKDGDPADQTNAIVGIWESSGDRLTFNSDGTGTWAEGRNADGTFGEGAPIRYTVNGSVLTIDEDEIFTFSVDGDTLILNSNGTDVTFHRP